LLSGPKFGLMSPGGAKNMTRKYEAFYIVKPDLTDDGVQKIADRYKAVVEEHGGTVEKAGKWDKRKLAYEINDFKEGNYILMNFEADAKVPTELNRLLRISDDVIRHRIFKLED
jgi:small subunit ribosomal protein S6